MKIARKVVMVIFGSVLILEGLLDIFMPEQRALAIETGNSSRSVMFYVMILGATWAAAGFWVIAASRDPLRHIYWLKFVMTLPVLLSAVLTISIIRGYVTLEQVVIELALNAVFAISLLALYPWRSHSGNQPTKPARIGGVDE